MNGKLNQEKQITMTTKTRLDEFRVKEKEGRFIVQQKVHIKKHGWLTKEREYEEWDENVFGDSMVAIGGKDGGCFMCGEFRTLEQAKKAIEMERKDRGFKKKDVKYHKY